MTTSITIHTDDMELVANIAALVAGGKATKPLKSSVAALTEGRKVEIDGVVVKDNLASRTQTATPPPATPIPQMITTAQTVTQPAPVPTLAVTAQPAAVPQDEHLKNAIKLFLQSPGQDAGKCAVIMREFTDKKVVGKDGVERQSANRADVPAANVDACIAKLKAGMPAEFQAQV